MKRYLGILTILIALFAFSATPAAAQNRYIVRTSGGLGSVLEALPSCKLSGPRLFGR